MRPRKRSTAADRRSLTLNAVLYCRYLFQCAFFLMKCSSDPNEAIALADVHICVHNVCSLAELTMRQQILVVLRRQDVSFLCPKLVACGSAEQHL